MVVMSVKIASAERRQFGPWSILRHNASLVMDSNEINGLIDFACRWQNFAQDSFVEVEQTYLQKNFGLSGVMIRLDYIMRDDRVMVYEIEERPALAVGMWTNPDVKSGIIQTFFELEQYSGKKVKVLVSNLRKENTDDWVLPELTDSRICVEHHEKSPCECADSLYYVRSHRTEESYWNLAGNAISTIKSEGIKSYGLNMGLWHKVTDAAQLDFDSKFALKPLAGSRCEEILFWSPDKSLRGRSTKTKLQSFFEKNPLGGYVQELIMPESADFLPEDYRLLRRSYLSYSPLTLNWKVLGGVWIGTDNIKIHGTRDSFSGVIINPNY